MGQGSTKIRGVKVAGIDVSNVQTPTPNACSTFRRRTVSPFDPTDFDAPLVEAATRSCGLASLARALGKQWEAHWREYAGVVASRRGAADTIRLDWAESWDEQRWPADPGERIRTRLGLDDRLIELSEPWISPFGEVIERMKIPGWMVKSPQDHEENARITGRTSTALQFHWGGGNFVYNRHGLDFAEDAEGEPSSPVRKAGRRRE